MKFLEAEEEDLAEGDGERAGQLGETESRRIAAKEKIENELLAGGDAGDERAAVLRKRGRNRVVRAISLSTAKPIRITDSCIVNLSFLSAEDPFNGGDLNKQTLQLPYKYLTKL